MSSHRGKGALLILILALAACGGVFDPLDVTFGEDNEKNSCLADGTEE